MKDTETKIAEEGLGINAIKLNSDNPFQWASGFRMPIYNDNRMFLANYNHRMLVADGFLDLINSKQIPFNYIMGTSTAGIAPAASVANINWDPLLIIENGKPFLFEPLLEDEINEEFDAIASTCPWAIPFGIATANDLQLPFMYVRQSKKAHGLKQQIEGIPIEGQEVLLLDYHRGESYLNNAEEALKEKGVKVKSLISKDISETIKPVNIEGKKIIEIEDLISTGGSSAKSVQDVRDLKGECNYCLSIFNYGLDKAVQAFDSLNPKCYVESLLTYNKLLEVAKETGYINNEQVAMLQEWRADPYNWGEKHGFPKVEKGG